jgi:hypothetical protein
LRRKVENLLEYAKNVYFQHGIFKFNYLFDMGVLKLPLCYDIYTIMLQWSSQLKTQYTWMLATYYKQKIWIIIILYSSQKCGKLQQLNISKVIYVKWNIWCYIVL